MKNLLIVLVFFSTSNIFAQLVPTKKYHYWKKLVLVTKSIGINSEGIKVHVYNNKNRKKLASEWIFPWALGFEQSEINKDLFAKSDYISYSSIYASIGRNGFKHFRNDIYFNGMVSVGLGNEKLTDYNNQKKDQFLIGLEASQGLLYIPQSDFGWVLGLGIFEKVYTSKIYNFDIGIQLTAGITF